MNFPPTRWKILHQYQTELELWVEQATEEHIKQYLTEIHGCVYPDDWKMCVYPICHLKLIFSIAVNVA